MPKITPSVFTLHRPARALSAAAAQMQLRRMQTRTRTAAAATVGVDIDAVAAANESEAVAGTVAPSPAAGAATKRRSSKASTDTAAADNDIAPRPSKKAKTPRAGAAAKASKSSVIPIAAAIGSSDDKILYTYEHLVPGRLIRRYKRFLADVELVEPEDTPSGTAGDAVPVNLANVVTVHCPNTGPMIGLLDLPHARVQLSKSADPKRKYAYTLEMIQVDNGERRVWVGVHSTLANRMVERAIAAQWLPELGLFSSFQREVKFAANSRVDFVLSRDSGSSSTDGASKRESERQKYVEVKSVSFAHPVGVLEAPAGATVTSGDSVPFGNTRFCALFPDTVSDRAQKHVTELTELIESRLSAAKKRAGASDTTAAIVFLVQRDDCHAFAPSFLHDVKFADLCAQATEHGVQLLAYAVALEPQESKRRGHVRLLRALPLHERAVSEPVCKAATASETQYDIVL